MAHPFPAVTFVDRDLVEVREYRLADVQPHQFVVKTRYSMVSTGTELRVLGGHYGVAGSYPAIPGYASVGEVVEVGSQVKGFRVGDRVSCRNPQPVPGVTNFWGGQSALQLHVEEGMDRPVRLPDGAEFRDYVTVEIAAISLRGVTQADPQPGETAVVVGQGLIGAFSAAWLSARGCRVIATDLQPARLERARKWAAEVIDLSEPHGQDRLRAACNGGADIVVETSGSAGGATTALHLLRASGQGDGGRANHTAWPRLIFQANYLDEIPINPYTFFPGEGVTILAPFDRGVCDRLACVEYHRNGVIQAADFVDRERPYRDAPAAYHDLANRGGEVFSTVFAW